MVINRHALVTHLVCFTYLPLEKTNKREVAKQLGVFVWSPESWEQIFSTTLSCGIFISLLCNDSLHHSNLIAWLWSRFQHNFVAKMTCIWQACFLFMWDQDRLFFRWVSFLIPFFTLLIRLCIPCTNAQQQLKDKCLKGHPIKVGHNTCVYLQVFGSSWEIQQVYSACYWRRVTVCKH